MSDGNFTITVDEERGFLRVDAQGNIDKQLGEELITNARLKARKNQLNILCDVRRSNAKVSLSDWFFLPRTLSVYKNTQTRSIKTAILITPGNQEEIYEFFENVTYNLGLNIRIFLSEDDAINWLGRGKLDSQK